MKIYLIEGERGSGKTELASYEYAKVKKNVAFFCNSSSRKYVIGKLKNKYGIEDPTVLSLSSTAPCGYNFKTAIIDELFRFKDKIEGFMTALLPCFSTNKNCKIFIYYTINTIEEEIRLKEFKEKFKYYKIKKIKIFNQDKN